MKYTEGFRNKAAFIETEGRYDIYGRIENEDSGYILLKGALIGDGKGRVSRVHGIVINKSKVKKAKSMEREDFLGIMLERYETYAFRHIISYILFLMAAISFGLVIGKFLNSML